MISERYTHSKVVILLAFLDLLVCSMTIIPSVHATPSSISLSISSSPVVILHSSNEGKFADSGNSTITITTNHAAGYTLTAKANNSTSLEGTKGGNIPSISTAVSPANYADDTYASTNSLNDTWGYKPSVLYNSSTGATDANTNYLPSPGLGTAQSPADTLAVTNNANDGSYTVSIGTRVTTATDVDSYSNAFVFTVIGNPTPYAITYDQNTTDTVTNMPTNHTTSDPGATGETVTIDSTVPVRDGYIFKGWCSVSTSDDTCSGTTYNPDGGGTALSLAVNQQSSSNAFTVYAMWGIPAPKTIADSATMQEVASCPDTLTIGQVFTIEDARDNQDYKVARLADGKCWMVENLNLAGGTAISADTSDVDASYVTNFTTSKNLTKDATNNTIILPASSTSGFENNNYSNVYNSGNKTNCGASGQNIPCYSYYSWDAATLGSGRSIGTDNTDAPYSICPKGWRLPTSGSRSNNGWKRGDFYALATAYGANLESNYYDDSATTGANFYDNAGPGTTPNFLLAGSYYYSSFSSGGSAGLYWSSTSYSDIYGAWNMGFDSGGIQSANDFGRRDGFSIRCLFSAQ